MTQPNSAVRKGDQREIVISRFFDAPCELVWRAWTDPEQVVRWWGPKDFTSHSCTIDFRVGGKYVFCMRWPDGRDFWSTGTYQEIIELERIVCTDSFADPEGNVVPASYYDMSDEIPLETLISLTFEAQGSKTRLTLTHAGLPTGEMGEGAEAGWNQSLDKLAETLI